MWKHLWTHKAPPSDYILLQLCDRFGAGILQLDVDTVDYIIAMWEVESGVASAKSNVRKHTADQKKKAGRR